jgi:hypothetical protein
MAIGKMLPIRSRKRKDSSDESVVMIVIERGDMYA